jgi:hypothetical protein
MIKDHARLKKLEDDISRKAGPLDFTQALKLFSEMWKEAVSLGVLPPQDPMKGIETDIRIARILNSCSKNYSSE